MPENFKPKFLSNLKDILDVYNPCIYYFFVFLSNKLTSINDIVFLHKIQLFIFSLFFKRKYCSVVKQIKYLINSNNIM